MTPLPPTLTPEQLCTLAAMLPEVVRIETSASGLYTYLCWNDERDDQDNPACVRPTEHDYLVRLAEATLTEEDDQCNYAHELWKECNRDEYEIILSTPSQRLTALAKVNGGAK